jgi:hypothetical protein
MSHGSWQARVSRAGVALGACSALIASGCTTQLSAPTVKVLITVRDTLVAQPPEVRGGEVLIRVENQAPHAHTLALVALDPGVPDLPAQDGQLQIGKESDLTYRGTGYQVVAKLERLRKHVIGRSAAVQLVHQYMRPGAYVLVDVDPTTNVVGPMIRIQVR